jgi:natural product biosynthesis luciferase-like monooxygenase protein
MMVTEALSCVLVGDDSLLAQCAEVLRERGHTIAAIVTETAAISAYAAKHGIRVVGWSENLAAELGGLAFDWLFSAANLRIIPDSVWQLAKRGAVNFHDGPLPRYAGLNAPAWALMEGQPRHGVAWHAIATEVDAGQIYSSQQFDIAADETSLTINSKCFEAGISTFTAMLQQIETGTLRGQAQDFTQRSYYDRSKRPTDAATLRFNQPAQVLSRLVRGLDFGAGYANPLVTPKLRAGSGLYEVTGLSVLPDTSSSRPGTVLAVSAGGVLVATADHPVLVTGRRIGDHADLAANVAAGELLPGFDAAESEALSGAVKRSASFEAAHRRRLVAAVDVDLMDVGSLLTGGHRDIASLPLTLPPSLDRTDKVALVAAFVARLGGQQQFSLAYGGEALAAADSFLGYFADTVPLNFSVDDTVSLAGFVANCKAQLDLIGKHGPYLSDLPTRFPGLAAPSLTVGVVEGGRLPATCAVAFVLGPDGDALSFDPNRVDAALMEAMARRLELMAGAFVGHSGPLAELPLMSAEEERHVLFGLNETALNYDTAGIHTQFERQVDRTPDAVAVASGLASLTYRELDERANRLAHALIAAGVGPDALVGLHVSRSADLVAGALAILKAGGAYVPLDPMFPADRLELMVEDSAARVVLTERALHGRLQSSRARMLVIEDLLEAGQSDRRPAVPVAPENLAYVIYTSGSTGRPKGVMIEHGNVLNFFAGMDDRVPVGAGPEQPVWLAVTSLSFDISVLELFWTLHRGFKVVIQGDRLRAEALEDKSPRVPGTMDFSLYYWGNDAGQGHKKYHLLLEGARFADTHGFCAVWTPERHFHAFGGPYPNPSVTGAAVAAVTKTLDIRAGSCVLPLHHTARVAEEWAVIDNLCEGRSGIAIASGWMPEDFVLRPENAPPNNRDAMLREIDVFRRLWRGEKVGFPLADGRIVEVVTQPRPVQPEPQIWLTTAGNPETYRDAARQGLNVLTHLLGQSIAELEGKIKIYHDTLRECGRNPDDFRVTLLLHTFVAEDREVARDLARGPMKEYLRSAAALIKQYAWAFPAFKKPQGTAKAMDIDLGVLTPEELDDILEFAFLRYFEDSGLFGTVEDAARRVEQVAAIGVDEIACLIDFGVSADIALQRLEFLATVVQRPVALSEANTADQSLAAEVDTHGVTHLQCTPSMARMFLSDDASRKAIGTIEHLFIGGEPLPSSLVAQLRDVTPASIENMYGPTETTIWSSTMMVGSAEGIVPLGRPIANTQLYVLDSRGRPVPTGSPGELFIGGDGVARGYHNRPDLTADRFLPNPYTAGRFYRTGDLARFLADGTLQFLGRTDHQVKVRGYRIELGEIESRIAAFPGIAEVVVMAREDRADDVRLVAYVRLSSRSLDEEALRQALSKTLPYYMVPSHFVTLDAFPLTPNAKVDRKALPAPLAAPAPAVEVQFIEPADSMQRGIAETFRRILGVERVGQSDSFFALGGHSLLAVQAHRELKASIAPDMAITDLFRFPTVAALAAHLTNRGEADEGLSRVANRAASRRAAMGARLALAPNVE